MGDVLAPDMITDIENNSTHIFVLNQQSQSIMIFQYISMEEDTTSTSLLLTDETGISYETYTASAQRDTPGFAIFSAVLSVSTLTFVGSQFCKKDIKKPKNKN